MGNTNWFPYKPSLWHRLKMRVRTFWGRRKYQITARRDEKSGYFWHVHHEELYEYTDNIQQRIDYILLMKPERERALRLKLMRRIQSPLFGRNGGPWPSTAVMEALHAQECDPDCPWDGRTIFSASGQEYWGG